MSVVCRPWKRLSSPAQSSPHSCLSRPALRRPSVRQERLTSQIADTLDQGLNPLGAGVVIQAEHLCMKMREGRTAGSHVVTSANRGAFRNNAKTRAEFLAFIDGKAQ